jgi:hypothetical protein
MQRYYVVVCKASRSMQHNVVVHNASQGMLHYVVVLNGVTFVTQHFVVAKSCRRKAKRLTHLIMYTYLYNIM